MQIYSLLCFIIFYCSDCKMLWRRIFVSLGKKWNIRKVQSFQWASCSIWKDLLEFPLLFKWIIVLSYGKKRIFSYFPQAILNFLCYVKLGKCCWEAYSLGYIYSLCATRDHVQMPPTKALRSCPPDDVHGIVAVMLSLSFSRGKPAPWCTAWSL